MSFRAIASLCVSSVVLLLITAVVLPQKATADERLRIGLALSGGGARGAAHVGVLRVLEEQRIPIDYIAGTSMGSIVGGLYASGMSPDQIEQALAEIPWGNVFNDRAPREERRFRRKQDDYTYLVEQKPGIKEKEGEINLAPALVQGQKFDLTLRKYTLPVAGVKDFDRLRIPFRAVATDIVTGRAVVLGSGDLATAIRASMAVPAAFAPVEIDDKLLVDGGIAMNLPVSVVRDMGADVVIAVDISTPGLAREDIRSALDMLNQLSSLMTRRDTENQIASLKGRDVLIVPELGAKVTSADFKPDKLHEAVVIGEAGARAQLEKIARLGISPTRYASYRTRTAPPQAEQLTIDFVRVENQSRLSDEVITRRLGIRPGEPLDVEKIEQNIGRIYDQDNFESVRYRIVQQDGKTGVVITAKEKSWGTSSLQLGLELSSVSSDDSQFNLGAAYTMMPVNDLNGEWRTFLRVGEEPLLFTELYQPLDPEEKWFVNLGGGYVSRNIKLYDDPSSDTPTAEYEVDSVGVSLQGGRNLDDWGRLTLGYNRYTGDVNLSTGGGQLGEGDFESADLTLKLSIDTLDNVVFPSKGTRAGVYWKVSREALGADQDFDQAGFSVASATRRGRHRFNVLAYFETTPDDDAPVQDYFRLGGFGQLSGFNTNQLAGQHAALLRGGYFYDLQTDYVDTYFGGTLEAGNVWQTRDDIDLSDPIVAGSVFLGADTPVGPLFLGYGRAEGGNDAWYLSLGKPWDRF